MLLDVSQIKVDGVDKLSVGYWGADKKTHIKQYELKRSDMFDWCYFNRNEDDKNRISKRFTSWDDKPVIKKKSKRLNQFRIYEYLDNLPEADKKEIFSFDFPNAYFCDIETEAKDGFPDPKLAEQRITLIGLCTPNRNIIVHSIKNLTHDEKRGIQRMIDDHFAKYSDLKFTFKFKYYETEYDMLTNFLANYVSKIPFLTGWNFVEFDWEYIYNRAKKLGIDPSIASPIGELTPHGANNASTPTHVGIFDYMRIYDKWDQTVRIKKNLKLDTAGLDVIGVQKVKYNGTLQELYENDFQKYVFYNAIDCGLVYLIDQKIHTMNVGLLTGALPGIPATSIFSTVKGSERYQMKAFYNKGKVLPVIDKHKKCSYEGAFVKAPIAGFHRYCTCFDFASLYPSIMRQFNMSPETFVCQLYEGDEDYAEMFAKYNNSKDYIVTASGAVFKADNNSPGLLKVIVTDLYATRKSYKKQMLNAKQMAADIRDKYILDPSSMPEDERDVMKKSILDTAVFDSFQLACKLIINSIYGSFGSELCYFCNYHIAEAITKQGKHAILTAEACIEDYYHNKWHKETDLHKFMGVRVKHQIPQESYVSVYCDTDSNYVTFEPAYKSTDWDSHNNWHIHIDFGKWHKDHYLGGLLTEQDCYDRYIKGHEDEIKHYEIKSVAPDPKHFVFCSYENRIKKLYEDLFEKYAIDYNSDNTLNFEMEAYADAGIWLSKKKYIKNILWVEPDVNYAFNTHIDYKGIEMVQSGTPPFAREAMDRMYHWLFDNPNFTTRAFANEMKKIKREFMLANTADIVWTKNANNYQEFVVDDKENLILKKGVTAGVRAMALHNHLLHKNNDYARYGMLKDGQKSCFYYCKGEEGVTDFFAYEPGNLPRFAPDIDYDKMFDKTILSPMNRVLEACGKPKLKLNLTFINALW